MELGGRKKERGTEGERCGMAGVAEERAEWTTGVGGSLAAGWLVSS